MTKTVELRDFVKVHYTCLTNDGLKYSTRDLDKPIEFVVGEGKLLRPLEEGIAGMRKNEKRTIRISHENAYGNWEKELIREIDRANIPEIIELKKGLELYLTGQNGKEIKLRIIEVKEKILVIDENHLLAGKDLTFEIEIIDIEKSGE
jgi:FKBP-type peptidyl-prolyl cis-trans isomerase SlpA